MRSVRKKEGFIHTRFTKIPALRRLDRLSQKGAVATVAESDGSPAEIELTSFTRVTFPDCFGMNTDNAQASKI